MPIVSSWVLALFAATPMPPQNVLVCWDLLLLGTPSRRELSLERCAGGRPRDRDTGSGSDDAAARYKSIYGKHDDHTRGTVGIDAYAEAGVGHGATWWGAASGPSSARSAAISLRISATMARTASSSCDVRSVSRVAL